MSWNLKDRIAGPCFWPPERLDEALGRYNQFKLKGMPCPAPVVLFPRKDKPCLTPGLGGKCLTTYGCKACRSNKP